MVLNVNGECWRLAERREAALQIETKEESRMQDEMENCYEEDEQGRYQAG